MGAHSSCCDNDSGETRDQNYERNLYVLHVGRKFLDDLERRTKEEAEGDPL